MRSAKQPESEEALQITIPLVTKKSLKMKSAESGDTMRELHPVPKTPS